MPNGSFSIIRRFDFISWVGIQNELPFLERADWVFNWPNECLKLRRWDIFRLVFSMTIQLRSRRRFNGWGSDQKMAYLSWADKNGSNKSKMSISFSSHNPKRAS